MTKLMFFLACLLAASITIAAPTTHKPTKEEAVESVTIQVISGVWECGAPAKNAPQVVKAEIKEECSYWYDSDTFCWVALTHDGIGRFSMSIKRPDIHKDFVHYVFGIINGEIEITKTINVEPMSAKDSLKQICGQRFNGLPLHFQERFRPLLK